MVEQTCSVAEGINALSDRQYLCEPFKSGMYKPTFAQAQVNSEGQGEKLR